MTFYVSDKGFEMNPRMTSRDLKYVIGLCSYERDLSPSFDQMAENVAKEAIQDERYWTPEGLDLPTLAQRVVQFKLDDMRLKWDNNTARYVAGSWPVNEETSRFLERIYEGPNKPILVQEADNSFLYEGEDVEEVGKRVLKGELFIEKAQKNVDQLRGLPLKPVEEKRKNFLENMLCLFGLFGKRKRGHTPDP